MPTGQPLVSVIVPTKNSAATLAACLESVGAQSYPSIEIIVVDNHSIDDTVECARRFADEVAIAGPERCAQRNLGARKAKGDYLLFIDSDMELTPTVVAAAMRELVGHDGVVAAIIPEESFGIGFWARCKRLERSFYVGVDWMEAARLFRRTAFEAVGGYDESLVSGEDWDLSQRVGQLGEIVHCREFIRHNEGRPTLMKLLRKKWYYAGKFAAYAGKPSSRQTIGKQTGLWARYCLFLSQPRKLFSEPALGLGVLLMKTGEFAVGAVAYVMARARRLLID